MVSGAFFGDKISPLSDTTNLALAVTGVNVFDHIKNRLPATIPAMLIALEANLVAGYYVIEPGQTSFGAIDAITEGLASCFHLGWIPLLAALLVSGPIPHTNLEPCGADFGLPWSTEVDPTTSQNNVFMDSPSCRQVSRPGVK